MFGTSELLSGGPGGGGAGATGGQDGAGAAGGQGGNCLACDHDCGGGECLQGGCQAVELASFPGMHGLLLDEAGDRVFFATSNFGEKTNVVGAVSKLGEAMQVEDLTSPTEAWDIVQDDGYYYFSDKGDGTLRRIAKPAVGNEPTEPMASGLSGARGLALDDDFVYVVSGTAVTRLAKAPPFANTVVAAAAAGNQIAIDEQFIYWTNFGSGTLMKIAKPL